MIKHNWRDLLKQFIRLLDKHKALLCKKDHVSEKEETATTQ